MLGFLAAISIGVLSVSSYNVLNEAGQPVVRDLEAAKVAQVYIIDEEDGIRGFEFLDNSFEPLFKLPAIHGSGHQRSNIQLKDALPQ